MQKSRLLLIMAKASGVLNYACDGGKAKHNVESLLVERLE